MSRIRTTLQQTPHLRTFSGSVLVDSIGTGLYLAGATIYAVSGVGLSPHQVGVALGVAGLAGFCVTAPLGAMGARVEPLALLRLLQLVRAAGFVALAFADSLTTFILASCLIAAAGGAAVPLTQCLVGGLTHEGNRTDVMALVRSLRNVGFSLGALGATPLIAAGTLTTLRAIVLLNAATFVVAVVLLGRLRDVPRQALSTVNPLVHLARFRDGAYLGAAAGNGLLSLHISMLSVGIPMWTLTRTEAPPSLVAVLIAINTVMAVALQIPMTARARTGARGLSRTVWRSSLCLVTCTAALSLAGHLGARSASLALVVAVVMLTLGEIWQAAAGWEMSFAYAPQEHRAVYLAVFSLGGAGQQVIGPFVLAAVTVPLGTAGWAGLAAVFLVAAAVTQASIHSRDRAMRSTPVSSAEASAG